MARSGPRSVDERPFHAWLAHRLPAGHSGLLPLGDDAAALRPPPGRVAVVTTDSLVEGTHFLTESPPRAVGAAAVGVSLSDVAAKGAEPAAVLLALLMPPGTPTAWAEQLTEGAEATSRLYGAEIVGGDTKPSPVRSVVSTVLGWGDPHHLAPRSAARPGDRVVTTGTVGRGGLAAWRLEHGPGSARQRLTALLEVRPRVREGVALGAFAHAMMDTSDGLADSARLLSAASGVRIEVDEERLPLARGLERVVPPRARRAAALFGGDYELLATLPPGRLSPASQAVARAGGQLTEIGRVVRGRGAWLGRAGTWEPMPPAGWQPFARASRRSGRAYHAVL